MVVVFIVLLISSFVMAMENLSQRALQNQLFDFKINIVFSMIQGDKERQEDMVYVPTSINEDHLIVAAVFDGNGRIGQEAIEKDLVSRLIRYCNQSNINDTNPKMSIKEIFMLINNELGDVQEEISKNNEYPHTDNFFSPWHTAGSTALVLFRIPKKEQLVIGWCGDSEAIWSEDGQLKNIEPAHRLKKCVGQYFFYRSFGNSIANDPDRSRFVKDSGCQMSAEPDSIIINNPRGVQFILMATDGLWTYSSKEEVFDFINQCLKQGTLGPLNLGNQDIVNRIMLLSILNDVKHNLVNKWFQFFFKEYIRIIFPGLRQKNVSKVRYVKSLNNKVQELNCFMQGVQFALDDFPFRASCSNLYVKNYMALSCPVDNEVIKQVCEKGETFAPKFSLADTIEEHKFPVKYNVDAKTTNEELKSMHAIIRYLYSNLDDGFLDDRLTKVFALDFDSLKKDEGDDDLFCYRQKYFLHDLKKNFLQTQNAIDIIKKDSLPSWPFDRLVKIIQQMQFLASDNTSIVFITTEKNEQGKLPDKKIEGKNKQEGVAPMVLEDKQQEPTRTIEQPKVVPSNLQSGSEPKKTQEEDGQSICSAFLSRISSIFQFFANLLSFYTIFLIFL